MSEQGRTDAQQGSPGAKTEHVLVHTLDGRFACVCGTVEPSPDLRDLMAHITWALNEDRARLRKTLRTVLGLFTEKGYPGEPCLRTGWISERHVAAWREEATDV